jgi:NAD+ diphosphatase
MGSYLIKMFDDFKASVAPPDLQVSQAWWFIFSGYQLLVGSSEEAATIPSGKDPAEFGAAVFRRICVGTLAGLPCYAAELAGEIPAELSPEDLRSLFDRLQDGFYAAALTAVHLLEWDKNAQFCGKCGQPLKPRRDMQAKECAQCNRLEFPRLSPAIIVLIENGDTLLLARSARFAAPFFSVLAGFVEPGESLEAAVHREVMEETGISVSNVRYFGSQPWPYPDSLMIGFTAQYESGEIRIDGEEIVEAGWYRVDNLPRIPGKVSIARQLIDSFIAKHSR